MRYKFSKLHPLSLIITFAVGVTAFQVARVRTWLYDRESEGSLAVIAPITNQANDEPDVYQALLRDSCWEHPYVVKDMTERWWDSEAEVQDLENLKDVMGVHSETIKNYILNNRSERRLTKAELNVNCPLISKSTFESFFDQTGQGWRDFYKTYPKTSGAFSVSRVGFNENHDEAIIYVATQCGGLCGHGEFTLLEKEGAVWRIKQSFPLWES